MRLINNLVRNNLFIFKDGSLRSLQEPQSDTNLDKKKFFLPILIVAREHYQEIVKTYPISERADVKQIVDNEFPGLKMTNIDALDLTSHQVKVFLFDKDVETFVRDNVCLFFPETMLSNFLREGELTTIERLNSSVTWIKKGATIHSSAGVGLYQNPQMFLYSSGAGEASSELTINERDYFALLLDCVFKLTRQEIAIIVKGQVAPKHILSKLHGPTIVSGALFSIVFYWLSLFAIGKWNQNINYDGNQKEEVRAVIALQKQLDAKLDYARNLNFAIENRVSGETIWSLVTELLENQVVVTSLMHENGTLKLSFLTQSSADTVRLIDGLPMTKSVTVDGDITDFQGKQRVTALVELKDVVKDV